MSKMLVETTGPFMLMDDRQEVEANRPSVVEATHFIQDRISKKQLTILGQLKDEATDVEFAKFVDESGRDMPLAVGAFLSVFGADVVSQKGDQEPASDDDDTDDTDDTGEPEPTPEPEPEPTPEPAPEPTSTSDTNDTDDVGDENDGQGDLPIDGAEAPRKRGRPKKVDA